MSSSIKRNISHSVFQRLKNYAKTHGSEFNLVLLRYGMERFLYRLSISRHADHFILKGASLFLVWKGQNFRVTKDADFLCYGNFDIDSLVSTFADICTLDFSDDDGVIFLPDSIKADPIREEQEYGGIRITITGMLSQARIPLQIDIGFGDIVTPEPDTIKYPTILDTPSPKLRAYPHYTVIAEKLEAMVSLGIANSRMKDFYDLWLLSTLFDFNGKTLSEAVSNTFKRRQTQLPKSKPIAFTDEFKKDPVKQTQWNAFVRKSKPDRWVPGFYSVLEDIESFLQPILSSLKKEAYHSSHWTPGHGWQGE